MLKLNSTKCSSQQQTSASGSGASFGNEINPWGSWVFYYFSHGKHIFTSCPLVIKEKKRLSASWWQWLFKHLDFFRLLLEINIIHCFCEKIKHNFVHFCKIIILTIAMLKFMHALVWGLFLGGGGECGGFTVVGFFFSSHSFGQPPGVNKYKL